jgi:predicted AlkP superfamily phosphohydrolase/phosphomutase
MSVFHEAHCIGHICWHLHDPTHEQYSPEASAEAGDPVRDVYVALDRAFGHIMEAVDEDTNVILFTGPGMGRNYSGNHILDEVLRRLDRKKPALDRLILSRTKDVLKFPLRALPEGAVRQIIKHGKKIERDRASKDWEGRSCFAILPHNDISGAIRLNIVGREPNGVIPPEQVESYIERLTEDLLQVRNLDSGQPMIARVYRTKDLCHGDMLDELPDLYVEWNRDAPLNRVGSDKIGEVKRKQIAVRTGDHTSHCFAAFKAPRTQPGRMNREVDLTDLAPTIAAMLGLGDIGDYDGEVVSAVGEPPAPRRSPEDEATSLAG